MNRDVLEYLDSRPGEKTVIWIHYFDVHWPYGPIDVYGREFLGDAVDDLPSPYSYAGLQDLVEEVDNPEDPVATTVLPGIYRAGVRSFDDKLGNLLNELDSRGLFDPALVVVTSDHGDEFFEHGEFGHGNNLFDTTVRVPLLIKLPEQAAPQRYPDPVSLIDVGPTILESCGSLPDGVFPGESLISVMEGKMSGERAPVFELVNLEMENVKGIVGGRFKMILEVGDEKIESWIYSLDDDARPLDKAAFRDQAQALRSRILNDVREWDPRLLLFEAVSKEDAPSLEIENVDEIIEQLKALGYVHTDGQ
jgi:hypothetical protein